VLSQEARYLGAFLQETDMKRGFVGPEQFKTSGSGGEKRTYPNRECIPNAIKGGRGHCYVLLWTTMSRKDPEQGK